MKIRISTPFNWGKKFEKGSMKTYYVWGANSYNYKYPKGKKLGYTDRISGEKKEGSGMAGDETKKFPGPTKGKAHPNFVGLVTIVKPGDTLEDIYAMNKERTEFLIKKLKKGFNIEFPLDPDSKGSRGKDLKKYILENHGLGQGVAKKRAVESKNPQDLKDWESVQNNIRGNIEYLFMSLDKSCHKKWSKKWKEVMLECKPPGLFTFAENNKEFKSIKRKYKTCKCDIELKKNN